MEERYCCVLKKLAMDNMLGNLDLLASSRASYHSLPACLGDPDQIPNFLKAFIRPMKSAWRLRSQRHSCSSLEPSTATRLERIHGLLNRPLHLRSILKWADIAVSARPSQIIGADGPNVFRGQPHPSVSKKEPATCHSEAGSDKEARI